MNLCEGMVGRMDEHMDGNVMDPEGVDADVPA